VDYIEKKRYRRKDGTWMGVLELIPDPKTFPDGIPFNQIEVVLWNMGTLKENAVEKEYQRRADKMKDKFLEPEPEIEISYSNTEINEILKKKKYFIGNEKFPDDLPDKPIVLEIE